MAKNYVEQPKIIKVNTYVTQIEKLKVDSKFEIQKEKLAASLKTLQNTIDKVTENTEEIEEEITEEMGEFEQIGQSNLPNKYKAYKKFLDTLMFHLEEKERLYFEYVKNTAEEIIENKKTKK